MKKKLVLLVSFICAFAVAFGVFIAGCSNKGKDDVTVTISKTELSLTVGGSSTLTATASDGSEIVWTTSAEGVATVNANGRVTAVSAGTATVTATVKDGTAKAECAVTVKNPVTFSFTKDGEAITSLSIDVADGPVQIGATASDGSSVSVWTVADPRVASVSNGVVTGLKAGETTITAGSSTGSGSIKLEVTDDIIEHSAIVEGSENAGDGEWWYFKTTAHAGATEIITNDVREGKLTFEYEGNLIWNPGDIQIGMKKDPAKAKTGWTTLYITITSDVEGTMTIMGTEVKVEIGENPYKIHYDQASTYNANNMVYIAPHADMGKAKLEISLVEEDLHWEDHTLVPLTAPSFTLNDRTVTISDPNLTDNNTKDGVKEYGLGFYKDGSETPIVWKVSSTTYVIDDMDLNNGDYTVKVMVFGIPGYVDSEWSTDSADLTVNNTNVQYDLLNADGHPENASSSRWYYVAVGADSVGNADVASYDNGIVTFKTAYVGWKATSTQIFRNYGEFVAGDAVKFVIKITSETEGVMTISGAVKQIAIGENEFTIYTTQASNPTITIFVGDMDKDGGESNASLGFTGAVSFTFEVKSIEKYEPEPLTTPSAQYTAADGETPATITVTGEESEAAYRSGYELGFFQNGELVEKTMIKSDGTFSDLTVDNGTYSLKVRAASANKAAYKDSDWSAVICDEYVVANEGGKITQLENGGESDSYANPGVWYEWHDEGWNGATVSVSEKYTTTSGEIHFTFSIDKGANTEAAHLYYHSKDYTPGNAYTITLKINSTVACTINVCGTKVDLKVGDNNISVNYTHPTENLDWQNKPQGATIRIFFENGGSFTLSDIAINPLTQTKLQAPSFTISAEKVITITDPNAQDAVSGYSLTIYAQDGTTVVKENVSIKNGDTLIDNSLEAGNYILKIKALPNGLLYTESDWSAEVAYEKTGEATASTYEANWTVVKPFAGDSYVGERDGSNAWAVWWVGGNWEGCGSAVTMNSYAVSNDELTVTYSGGSTNWCVQVFYNNTNCEAGQKYKLTCKINAERACTVTINGVSKDLVEGDNEIDVEFTQGNRTVDGDICSFDMQCGQQSSAITLKVSGVKWTEILD